MKIVHYINQFFAGIGGEEAAGAGPELREGAVGPGKRLDALLGDEHQIVATAVCDDDHASGKPEFAATLLEQAREAGAELLVAGPAFTSGRYGLACARIVSVAAEAGFPALAAMHADNPGLAEAAGAPVIESGATAREMRPSLERLAAATVKLAAGEELTAEDGRTGPVARINRMADRSAAERAVALLLRRLAGAIRRADEFDAALSAPVLLENLAGKASATLALLRLLADHEIEADSIDFVIGAGEEAIGDRYQRGGGNLAKAVAAAAGLSAASGMDVKNFCAAPVPALVVAGSLVASGVFRRVVVVAGGSLPKLGMKFQGHLKHDLPVLEDVLGGSALLVEADDGASPRVRLDSVGRHPVSAGSSNPKVMEALAIAPLERLGMDMLDIDDYATELHNPEITEPQGSGNVPERNYKTLAALAVRRGDIGREDIGDFVEQRGMPGYAPTQGHIASALCYLPHAQARLTSGEATRVQLIAKGSLFLGRMSEQSDGMSVILERNDGEGG